MTIDLNLNEEQKQIVSSLRSMLSDRFPVARLRSRSETGDADAAMLAAIAAIGGFNLCRAEKDGGAGLSIVEDVLLHIEFGRFLVTPSVLAAAIGVRLADEKLLPKVADAIASGASRVGLASSTRPFGASDLTGLDIRLFDSENCDYALLWRDSALVLLDARKLGMHALKPMDRSVRLAGAQVPTEAIIASASNSRLAATAQLLVSAQLLGVAEAARDMAADYAKIRTQFSQPIGSFQAIKHRCANMAIQAEVVSAQLALAAIAERDQWEDAQFQNDACRLIATRHALDNATSNIQVHGGIGFSSEADAHLYVLRAHLLENLGGRPQLAENRLMQYANPQLGGRADASAHAPR